MSVFGNIPAFNGFGKPSIKLEFDDNEALLEFQKKMQAAGDDSAELPEVDFDELKGTENLTPEEEKEIYNLYLYIQNNAKKLNTEKFSIKLLNDFEKEDKYKLKINTILGDIYINMALIWGKSRHIFKHIYTCFNVLKETLENPCIIIKSKDNNNNDVYCFIKSFYLDDLYFQCVVSPIDKDTKNLKTTYPAWKYTNIWNLYKKGGKEIIYPKNLILGTNQLQGLNTSPGNLYPPLCVVFRLPYKDENNFANNQIFNKENLGALNGYGDKYTVIDNRKRARKEPGELLANKNISFRKVGKAAENYNKDAYDESKYKNVVVITNFDGTFIEFQIFKAFTLVTKNTKLEAGFSIKEGADGKNYKGTLHREIVKANIKNLYNIQDYIPSKKQAYVTEEIYKKYYNEALKQFFDDLKRTIKYYQDELEKGNKYKYSTSFVQHIESYLKEAQKEYNYNVAFYNYNDLGKTANNAIYNNVGILDWRGFVPTYRILDDYSDFFKIADSKSTFAGFGLDDTKKLIAETCRQHWRDCMAIAKHLKGDSLLQSCFNLWHWLHYNIRYEYDREGREEIRTPLRVWQDRARGVDCDCLSVFAWCVLKCQGYNPVFELVAFKGRPQFSHIFVNCDGVVVDRVWFIFNNRPPLITKSEIYKIDLTNLAGLF